MSKELFIDAHEQLVAEYLERHPHANDATADNAWNRMRDNIADRADYLRMKQKESA